MSYQSFLVGLVSTKNPAVLAKADIRKLAERHSVPLEWAVMSLKHWRGSL